MADESPGKALREDVQAKQQALDEAKAALDKYEADKAAAANADAAEDAPMPDAPEASDDDDDELVRGPEQRIVAQRRDNEATAPISQPATPAPEALTAPGAGWALPRRKPSVKLQYAQLAALHLGDDDESGQIMEVYWANQEDLELDGRSMERPFANWHDSDAHWKEVERRRARRQALSELVVSRDVCECKARVVDGDGNLVEGARRCDVLSCQKARCERCLVANPMAFGAACGGCSPLVVAPEDAEDPGLNDGAPRLLRSIDVSALIGALENVLVDDSQAAQEALKEAWRPHRSYLKAPKGVHFSPNEEGRRHASILLRRLKLWQQVGRRLGMRNRGATQSRVTKFLSKYFAGEVVAEFKAQDSECKRKCAPSHRNPGEGNCESCAIVKKAIANAVADAQPELDERLKEKCLKRGREPKEDEVVAEATELLRVVAEDDLGSSDDDDSEEGDSSSSDDDTPCVRGQGPLVCDHVKYWAIFRVLACVQSTVFDQSLASAPRSSGSVSGATRTLHGSLTPSRTRGGC